MSLLVRLTGRYLRPQRGLLVVVVLLEALSVMALLALPAVNAALIDRGLVQGDLDQVRSQGLTMVAVSLGQVVAAVLSAYLGASVAMSMGRDMRRDVFEHVGQLSARELHSLGIPSLITRCTNDIQQIQMLVLMVCTMILTAPIMMIGAVAMAIRVEPALSWLLLAAVPLLAVVVSAVVVRMVPSSRRLQDRLDALNRVLREQLMGVRVIRAFAREGTEAARFEDVNTDLTATSRRIGRMMAMLTPIVLVILNLTVVAVLWFGGHRVDAGQMPVGALAAYLAYVTQILSATLMVAVMVVMLPRAAVSAERIDDVLRTESTLRRPTTPVEPEQACGVIEFDGVGLHHFGADSAVVEDLCFRADPGGVTAIVGSTGSGKTTAISLIARLQDPTDGVVRLDGVDLRAMDRGLLARSVGLVPQTPYLFAGSVRSNLCLGRPDASDGKLWQALEVAQAREFVAQLEGGLDAEVLSGGVNFSGGQRQRLSVARALVAQPRIYLLDDVFSALDAATAARMRAALRDYTRGATVIMVAPGGAAVTDAEQIIVLERGRVVGCGTHDSLLTRCLTYREILDSQDDLQDAR